MEVDRRQVGRHSRTMKPNTSQLNQVHTSMLRRIVFHYKKPLLIGPISVNVYNSPLTDTFCVYANITTLELVDTH